jgi:ABC-type sugar transport system ATPase subunit
MEEFVLEALNITKRFPGVIANENVNIKVRKSEIHGLIGENGAGKSTILRIFNGIYPAGTYEGEIILNGKKVQFSSPYDAMLKGIGFVPQEINVMDNLTVAENIFVGNMTPGKKNNIIINFKDIYKKTVDLLEMNNLLIDPMVKVRMLSIGQKQLLMVVRALSKDPKVLILDEPTTSLTLPEVENLFKIVKLLKEKGKSIIFVTHKLAEIMEITDTVTVLRDGKNISTINKENYEKETIICDMIGRKITNMYPKRSSEIGEEILKVEGLTVDHPKIKDRYLINNVSFSLKKGEVLGFAGLIGAGRTEVLETLYGKYKKKAGKISIKGKEVTFRNEKEALNNGIALVTEDRKKDGLLFLSAIKGNITISDLSSISKAGMILRKTELLRSLKYFKDMRIKAPSVQTSVLALSGGNQQKVVIARALNSEPEIILLDEPTKGIDVGSKNEIYNLINDLVKMGVSIIMVSSELPELMEMCDRFVVMANGEAVAEFSKEEVTEKDIMLASTKSGVM